MTERTVWEERHARGGAPELPSAFVARHVERLIGARPTDLALDLACGGGRHSRVLLDQGFRVVAVDFAAPALRTITGFGAHAVLADAAHLPLRRSSFDLIVQTCFLDRGILSHLAALLRPGGVLLIETFLRAQHEATGHPRVEFCLEPGELERLCAAANPTLELLDKHEGDVGTAGQPRHLAGIVARRP